MTIQHAFDAIYRPCPSRSHAAPNVDRDRIVLHGSFSAFGVEFFTGAASDICFPIWSIRIELGFVGPQHLKYSLAHSLLNGYLWPLFLGPIDMFFGPFQTLLLVFLAYERFLACYTSHQTKFVKSTLHSSDRYRLRKLLRQFWMNINGGFMSVFFRQSVVRGKLEISFNVIKICNSILSPTSLIF